MPKSLAAVRPAPLVPSPLPAADTEEKPPAAGREDPAVETGAANAVPGGEDAGSPLKREWRGSSGSHPPGTPPGWGRSVRRKSDHNDTPAKQGKSAGRESEGTK